MSGKWILVTNNPSHYREEIYRKLSSSGVDFHFASGDFGIARMELSTLESNVYISRCFRAGRFYFVPKAIRYALKYDHIILTGNFYYIHTWIILLLSAVTGKKTYIWSHAWYGRESRIKKLIKKIYFKLSNKVLTYGDYARGLMLKEGYSSEKIVPIYNSLSYEKHLPLRSSVNLSVANRTYKITPYLIFVGRITFGKKLSILAQALSILVSDYPSLKLVVIGGENDSGQFRHKISELGLQESVELRGQCYDESLIADALANALVCVSPGNVGLTAIHSMTFGTPVISHSDYPNQGPEFESIIPNQTGYFFEKDNPVDLADKIKFVLDMPSDVYERIRLRCMQEIDDKWNSRVQIQAFRKLGL